jgi:hypothetical protein
MKTLYEVPQGAKMVARDRKYVTEVVTWLNALGDDDAIHSTDRERGPVTCGQVRSNWIGYCKTHGLPVEVARASTVGGR